MVVRNRLRHRKLRGLLYQSQFYRVSISSSAFDRGYVTNIVKEYRGGTYAIVENDLRLTAEEF